MVKGYIQTEYMYLSVRIYLLITHMYKLILNG